MFLFSFPLIDYFLQNPDVRRTVSSLTDLAPIALYRASTNLPVCPQQANLPWGQDGDLPMQPWSSDERVCI